MPIAWCPRSRAFGDRGGKLEGGWFRSQGKPHRGLERSPGPGPPAWCPRSRAFGDRGGKLEGGWFRSQGKPHRGLERSRDRSLPPEGAGAFRPLNAASQGERLQPRAFRLSCPGAIRATRNPDVSRNRRNCATPQPFPGHSNGGSTSADHPRLSQPGTIPPACIRHHARPFPRPDHARSGCFA